MTRSTWNPNSPEALGLEFLGVGNIGYGFHSGGIKNRVLRFKAQHSGTVDKLTLYSGPLTNVPTLTSFTFQGHRFPYVAELVPMSSLNTGGPQATTYLPSSIVAAQDVTHYPGGGATQANDMAELDGIGVNPSGVNGAVMVHFPTASDFPLDRQVLFVSVVWSAYANNMRVRRRGDRNLAPTIGDAGLDTVLWDKVLPVVNVPNVNDMGEYWVEGGDVAKWHEVTPQMIRQFDSAIGNRRMEFWVTAFNPSFNFDQFSIQVTHLPERRVGTGVIEVLGGVANQRDVLVEIPFHSPGATGTPVSLIAGEEYALIIRNPHGGNVDYAASSNLDVRAITDQLSAAGIVNHFTALDWDWHDIIPYGFSNNSENGIQALGEELVGLPTAVFSITGTPTVDTQPYVRTVGGRVSAVAGEVLRQTNVKNPNILTEYRNFRFNVSAGVTLAGAGLDATPTEPLEVSFTVTGAGATFLGPFTLQPDEVLALGSTLNIDELTHQYYPVSLDFGSGVTFPSIFDVVFTSKTPGTRPWRVATLQSPSGLGADQTYDSGVVTYSAAAPTVSGATFTAFSTAVTGHPMNLPATVNANDLLFVFAGYKSGDAVTTQTPLGWTKLSTGNLGPVIFAKVAVGNEDGGTVNLISDTPQQAVGVTLRVVGAYPSIANGVSLAAFRNIGSGGDLSPNPPPATQPSDWFTAPLRVLAVTDWINDDVALSSNPAGYTAAASGVSGGGANNGVGIAVAHRSITAVTEDPGNFTLASNQAWAAHTVLVRPLPDGGGSTGSFAAGKAFSPVANTIQDLNSLTRDDVEFTLFTQAPEITGVDVSVLEREAHGATCTRVLAPKTSDAITETFNGPDSSTLGPDLEWERKVFTFHDYHMDVSGSKCRWVAAGNLGIGTVEDLQIPNPSVVESDVRASIELTSFTEPTLSTGWLIDFGLIFRTQLTEDGDNYRGYALGVGKSRNVFIGGPILWHMLIFRVDDRLNPTLIGTKAFANSGDITLPGKLTAEVIGPNIRAEFTHAGVGPPLVVEAVDYTYDSGLTALGASFILDEPGDTGSLFLDNLVMEPVVEPTCGDCVLPELPYARFCWSPSDLGEEFEFYEVQRREMDGEFATVAVIEPEDHTVTAIGEAVHDDSVAVTGLGAPTLTAVGDELLFCHWHSFGAPVTWSVTGTGMNPLGTALSIPVVTGASGFVTPNRIEFEVTDLDVRCEVNLADWTPGSGFDSQLMIGQSAPSNVAWGFVVLANGALGILYTTDGSTVNVRTSTVATGFTNGTWHWIRFTFDANDGGGNHVVKFFTSLDGVTWSQLGATVTTAGTVNLFNSTAPLMVGSTANSITNTLYRYVEVRNQIDGSRSSVIANADFHTLLPGTTSFVDDCKRSISIPNTWTVTGAPSVISDNEQENATGTGRSSSIVSWADVEVGLTGVRTATVSPAITGAVMSVLVRGHEGPPVIEQVSSRVAFSGTSVGTSIFARRGWWLLALFGTGDGDIATISAPSPFSTTWTPIVDSGDTNSLNTRLMAWIRPVFDDGVQSVVIPDTGAPGTWDYHLKVVALSNVAEFLPSCYDDWSAPYGHESCYRVRQGRMDGTVSDWSAEVCTILPPPANVDLIFTVPSDPEMNAAYNEAHTSRPVTREFSFLDGEDTTLVPVYGRDNQLAFRPTERRGMQFQRSLLVSPLCDTDIPCSEVVKPLRDLMTDAVPFVVVRDHCGNRWYASILLSSATQLRSAGLSDVWTANVVVTELASPVEGTATSHGHSE